MLTRVLTLINHARLLAGAWRGLVVASLIWYPNLSLDTHTKLLNFVRNVLQTERFSLKSVNLHIKD